MSDGPLGRLALARSTVDTATERRKDEAWLAAAWADPGTRVLRVHTGKTFVAGDRLAAVCPAEAGPGERFLLGVDEGGVVWFAVLEETEPEPPDVDGVVLLGLREVGALLDDRDAGLLVHAIALANWHAAHGFCARCGATTTVEAGGHVRRCPACGTEHYPRTDPAVIVLVTDDDGPRAARPQPALAGEPVHAPWPASSSRGSRPRWRSCARSRRSRASTSSTCRYLGSQPWPFPSSLMLGFTARAADPDARRRPTAMEIAEVRWFTREELRDGRGVGRGAASRRGLDRAAAGRALVRRPAPGRPRELVSAVRR